MSTTTALGSKEEKAYESIRIFKNPILEALTHTHWSWPFLIFSPVCAAFLFRASYVSDLGLGVIAGLFGVGFLGWTLAEYLLHRFILHFPEIGPRSKYWAWFSHGIHHLQPDDPTRVVLPPFFSIVLSFVFYWIFRATLGPILVDPFIAGFIVGYMVYDFTHFAVHHFSPRTSFGKMVKKNHMTHHFANHNSFWGVSSPLWDYVFRTTGAPGVTSRYEYKP